MPIAELLVVVPDALAGINNSLPQIPGLKELDSPGSQPACAAED